MLNNWPRRDLAASRVRRVPYFTQGNMMPFLRIKKPQPANLSRVLRNKIDQKQARLARMAVLRNYYVPLAACEDKWDVVLERECGVVAPAKEVLPGELVREEGSWAEEFDRQAGELMQLQKEESRQRMELGKRMWNIVEVERQLAEKEARDGSR